MHSLVTRFAGAISVSELGRPMGSLGDDHYRIANAFDFLVRGF